MMYILYAGDVQAPIGTAINSNKATNTVQYYQEAAVPWYILYEISLQM